MRRIATFVLAVAATFALVGSASADRKPTLKERVQIASVVHLPTKCARVRISTETRKSSGRWRFITAGSSFDCPELYAKVPRAIAQDLGIKCV